MASVHFIQCFGRQVWSPCYVLGAEMCHGKRETGHSSHWWLWEPTEGAAELGGPENGRNAGGGCAEKGEVRDDGERPSHG